MSELVNEVLPLHLSFIALLKICEKRTLLILKPSLHLLLN